MFAQPHGISAFLRRSGVVAVAALLLVACQGQGAASSPTPAAATSPPLASPTATAAESPTASPAAESPTASPPAESPTASPAAGSRSAAPREACELGAEFDESRDVWLFVTHRGSADADATYVVEVVGTEGACYWHITAEDIGGVTVRGSEQNQVRLLSGSDCDVILEESVSPGIYLLAITDGEAQLEPADGVDTVALGVPPGEPCTPEG